jgi:hypothetical protein
MLQESYKNQGNVGESAVAFKKTSSNKWNPNVPFTCTQEEFWEHIHQIERGEFSTWEEHKKKFNAWKEEYLTSLMQ